MEISAGASWLKGIANLDMPEQVIEESDDKKIITRYTPLGVVGAIVPWNFPVQLACGKIAPALLTGNTIIIKPSSVPLYSRTPNLTFIVPSRLTVASSLLSWRSSSSLQELFRVLAETIISDPGLLPTLALTRYLSLAQLQQESESWRAPVKLWSELHSSCESPRRYPKFVLIRNSGGNDPAIVCKSANIKEMAPQIATLAFSKLHPAIHSSWFQKPVFQDHELPNYCMLRCRNKCFRFTNSKDGCKATLIPCADFLII